MLGLGGVNQGGLKHELKQVHRPCGQQCPNDRSEVCGRGIGNEGVYHEVAGRHERWREEQTERHTHA